MGYRLGPGTAALGIWADTNEMGAALAGAGTTRHSLALAGISPRLFAGQSSVTKASNLEF